VIVIAFKIRDTFGEDNCLLFDFDSPFELPSARNEMHESLRGLSLNDDSFIAGEMLTMTVYSSR
jgi:hypothetical protein